MRIDLNAGIPPAPDPGQPVKPGPAAVVGSAGGALAADTAKLSTDLAGVAALAAAVNRLPEIRQGRVAALSEQVGNGTYGVTAEQTAGAIISHMLARPAA